MSASRKILVAVSGGVDSSVAAARLVEAGYSVSGAYMKTWIDETGHPADCPWQQDIEDARDAADRLGIPFRVINFMDAYRDRVVHYLIEGYRSGITPNPDMMCNREIKFGVFLEWALDNGFDAVATGHYARIGKAPDGMYQLLEGIDKNKDQSYFLALLSQEQLSRAIFPIGGMTKPEVRRKAAELGFSNAGKKDSQGICFMGRVKMADFLRARVPDDPGPIVDTNGNHLGEHRGLHLHTLGQRRGVGVASAVPHRAYVVVEKKPATKELVLALESESAPGLYSSDCIVGGLSFPGRGLAPPMKLLVRPRYRAEAVPALISSESPSEWKVHFKIPQRAITPGQIAAFYLGEQLVAGSIVRTATPINTSEPVCSP